MTFQKFKKLTITQSDVTDPADVMRVINNLQDNITTVISPMAVKSHNDSTVLTSISLLVGQNNIINHTLGRQLAGWKIVRKRAQADIWDNQDSNTSPNLTLWLSTSADVTIDIEVF